MTPAVCIIDDDHSVQRGLRRLLLTTGYRVLTCDSAEQFLSLSQLPRPICLLVDFRMQGMSGTELLDELARSGCELPVVMISGHANAATVMRAMAAGAVACLGKPFEEAALLAAIEMAVARDRRRLASALPVPMWIKG